MAAPILAGLVRVDATQLAWSAAEWPRLALLIAILATPFAAGGAVTLLAVSSGEEYELLVALPPAFGDSQARAFQLAHDLPLTRIGSCGAGTGVRFTDRGAAVAVPRGFDHFASG